MELIGQIPVLLVVKKQESVTKYCNVSLSAPNQLFYAPLQYHLHSFQELHNKTRIHWWLTQTLGHVLYHRSKEFHRHKKAATYKNNLVNLKALFVYSDDFLLYTDTVYTNILE